MITLDNISTACHLKQICNTVKICNTFACRHKHISYCLGCTLYSLLDTQDNNLEYVQFLQEEYNGYHWQIQGGCCQHTLPPNRINFFHFCIHFCQKVYASEVGAPPMGWFPPPPMGNPGSATGYYEHRTREYVEKLEKKSIAIQTLIYDSVAHDFDRVLDNCDNGLTSLQGQQDEQLEAVNGAENAIEHDASDILTEYPPWSAETYDLCDSDEAIYDRNRKEIQSELFKDTPVKTEDNKPYIDNIDACNRDRAQITQSLSDRLGQGQNSLPGAQQVIVTTKHTDQMTDIPDHFRQISLGEEIESISHKGRDRNRHIIPQLDGTMDSRDSLNQTLDSVDLTISPVKHRNEQTDRPKTNEDTNDNDADKIVKFNKDKARKVYRKDRKEQRDTEKTDEDKNDDTCKTVKFNTGKATKVYKINIEKKKILKERREKVLQNAKDRDTEKANAQAALQDYTRASKASKDNQDIKMTDDATIPKDSTEDVHLPSHPCGKAKYPSQIKMS